MTALQRLFLVIGSGLVLLALVAFILYPVFRSDEEPVEVAPVVVLDPVTELAPLPPDQSPLTTTQEQVVIEPLAGESIAKDEAVSRAEVERLTRLFVERFGSYSNFSNFSNISSIESFMTPSMLAYAQSFVEEGGNVGSVSGYYGVTTNIVGLKIDTITFDSTATVNIIVQEGVQDGFNADIQRRNRDGRVELVYSGGKWLVDGVFYN